MTEKKVQKIPFKKLPKTFVEEFFNSNHSGELWFSNADFLDMDDVEEEWNNLTLKKQKEFIFKTNNKIKRKAKLDCHIAEEFYIASTRY